MDLSRARCTIWNATSGRIEVLTLEAAERLGLSQAEAEEVLSAGWSGGVVTASPYGQDD